MNRSFSKNILILAIGFLPYVFAAHFASAAEPYAKFLKALQDNGYGDVALEYLERIEKRSDLPLEIRETLDLQRSSSFRSAAQNAYDARQADRLLADAQKYLDKFLKEHPDHPAAASSISSWGDSLFELGQRSLAAARQANPQQKAKLFADSREYFKQAGIRYAEAEKRFLARYEHLLADDSLLDRRPGAKMTPAQIERQEMETGAAQARFKSNLVRYHLAQTYDDPKSPERIELLQAAAKGFDEIFQQYRNNSEDERCTFARLWRGKTLVDLGDDDNAYEDFDELLVRDSGTSASAMAPIYTEATYFKYGVLLKQGKIEDLIADGAKWAETHKSWATFPYYNGAMLQIAKAYQMQAEKATGDVQRKILQKAVIFLADSSKIDSPYRSEILLLRRDLLKQLGTENVGAAEALALGDAARKDDNLPEAKQNYELALQKATDAKDQKLAEEAKLGLGLVAFRQVQNLFEQKKYDDAFEAAETMAHRDPADPSTARAAELALWSAYFLGAASKNKEDAFAQLEKTADFVKDKWPGRPVADMARMILAEPLLRKGDTAGALALYGEVKPASSKYPLALFNIGRIHWIGYLEEKKKENGRDERRMAEAKSKAEESLQKSIDLLQKSLGQGQKLTGEEEDPAEEARTLQLALKVQLLQTDMLLESKEFEKAASIIEPLIEKSKLDPLRSNETASDVFTAAIRVRLGQGEKEKAADCAASLLAISEDEASANAKLSRVARILGQELKAADAAVIEAQSSDPQNLEAVAVKRDAFKEQLRKLIESLGNRKEHSLADLVFLGESCFNLDLAEEGGQIYQNLLDRAKKDPAFAKNAEKALILARSQLIGLLRSQGKLDEAIKQAEELIAKNSKALEPKMTKADILEDLAKKDPKRLDDAIAQWTEIRLLLNRVDQKPQAYFEVIYKIANGLYQQSEKSKDAAKLASAEQLLKTTLIQYSKLSGPDMVARYNDLLKKIQTAKEKK